MIILGIVNRLQDKNKTSNPIHRYFIDSQTPLRKDLVDMATKES